MPIPSHTNFGWIRDPTSEEEKKKNPLRYSFRATTFHPQLSKISSFNLFSDSTSSPPVYDQGQIGSCTANATLTAYQQTTHKQGEPAVNLSRLLLYYNSRLREDTVNEDAGAMIPDVINVLQEVGVCDEHFWPYDTNNYTLLPSCEANTESSKHMATDCFPVNQDVNEIKQTLLQGNAVVYGMLVFPSMMSHATAASGIVRLPLHGEQPVGGHCVAICGWDESVNGGSFLVRNSWGSDWGKHGNFYIPYRYVLDNNLASDFWVIRSVKNQH